MKTRFGIFFPSQMAVFKGQRKRFFITAFGNLSHPEITGGKPVDRDFWRVRGTAIILALIIPFFVFSARLFLFQIIKHDYYQLIALQNRTFKKTVLPERGVILDRNGVVMARNAPGFRIVLKLLDPSLIKDEFLKNISFNLGIDPETVIKKVAVAQKSGTPYSVLKSNISKEEVSVLESKYSGNMAISIETAPVRENLYPFSTSHLLGFVGEDTGGEKVGKLGLEKYYENYLHGVAGYTLMETNSLGETQKTVDFGKAVAGDTLVLSIDVGLQDFSYKVLKDLPGAIVVQRVTDGSLITLVSAPGFDASLFNYGINQKDYQKILDDPKNPFFDRALSGGYAPGSVFKLIVAAGALSEGNIKLGQVVNVPGSIRIGSFIFRDWKESGHGMVDITRALGVSSDVFFYALGGGWQEFNIKGLGVEKISQYASLFGLGAVSGIDMPEESSGFLPSKDWKKSVYGEDWYIGDDFITAIGQGFVQATPLQINNATAAVANGGSLYKPWLVSRIELASGEKIIKTERVIRSNIVAEDVLNVVREGMKKACSIGGTAYPLFDFTPQIGCKTGTSEYGEKDKYGNYKTHAWITVFAPYDDPEYALTVFLEGGGEGSKDATPLAREILEGMVRMKIL